MSFGDKIGNKVDDAGGKLKEGTGKATGDRELQAEGETDQRKASLKDAGEHVKDAAKNVKDSMGKDDK